MTQDPLATAERMMAHAKHPILSALAGDANTVAAYAREEIRSAILALQDYLMSLPGAQLDCPVTHHFAPGSYAREMTIPAGVVIVGKIHRHAHVNVISKGRVRVVTEAGLKTLAAPCTFISEPGTKRVVLAETETVWTTVHATDETDLDKIEGFVIAKTYEDLGVIEAVPQQERLK